MSYSDVNTINDPGITSRLSYAGRNSVVMNLAVHSRAAGTTMVKSAIQQTSTGRYSRGGGPGTFILRTGKASVIIADNIGILNKLISTIHSKVASNCYVVEGAVDRVRFREPAYIEGVPAPGGAKERRKILVGIECRNVNYERNS